MADLSFFRPSLQAIAQKRITPLLASVLSGLLFCALLWPAYFSGFHPGDDNFYFTNARLIVHAPWSQVIELFASRANPVDWLPVRDLSFKFDVLLFGLNGIGSHFFNAAYYLVACLAAWAATSRLLGAVTAKEQALRAVLILILFAVHPAHVEVVSWISSRKDLLAGIFCFAAFYVGVRHCTNAQRLIFTSLAVAVLWSLSMMSKAASIGALAAQLVIAFDLYRRRNGWRRAVVMTAKVYSPAVVCAGLLFYRYSMLSHVGMPAGPGPIDLFQPLVVLGGLTAISVFPFSLSLFSPMSGPITTIYLVLGLSLLVSLAATGYMSFRHNRWTILFYGLVGFVLSVLPYLQISPFVTWSTVGDRFVFLAILFLLFGVIGSLSSITARVIWLAALVALSFLVSAGLRAQDWSSWHRLINAEVEKHAGHPMPVLQKLTTITLNNRDYEGAKALIATVSDPEAQLLLDAYMRGVQSMSRVLAGEDKAFYEAGMVAKEMHGLVQTLNPKAMRSPEYKHLVDYMRPKVTILYSKALQRDVSLAREAVQWEIEYGAVEDALRILNGPFSNFMDRATVIRLRQQALNAQQGRQRGAGNWFGYRN